MAVDPLTATRPSSIRNGAQSLSTRQSPANPATPAMDQVETSKGASPVRKTEAPRPAEVQLAEVLLAEQVKKGMSSQGKIDLTA